MVFSFCETCLARVQSLGLFPYDYRNEGVDVVKEDALDMARISNGTKISNRRSPVTSKVLEMEMRSGVVREYNEVASLSGYGTKHSETFL
jgi:hypothetical protein